MQFTRKGLSFSIIVKQNSISKLTLERPDRGSWEMRYISQNTIGAWDIPDGDRPQRRATAGKEEP